MVTFSNDIEKCLEVLRTGGIILYPTDTIWGIGCDATNEAAIDRIFELKKRADSKAMIVLVADERDVYKYVAHPDPSVFDYIKSSDRPTTVIFDGAIGLADHVVAEDGSIGIRICKDEFCRHLIKRLQRPLVSTSANKSGTPAPATFRDVALDIREGVDYVVNYRRDDERIAEPSAIVRFTRGRMVKLR